MDVVDEPQRSIIIAVSRSCDSPHPVSIIRLETPPPQQLVKPLPLPLSLPHPVNGNKFLAHVPHLLPLVTKDVTDLLPYDYRTVATWAFPLPTKTCPEKLYMFSNLFYTRVKPLRVCLLPGISFDLSTKNCIPIPPPTPPPFVYDLVIDLPATVGDSIFFLFEPCSFVCYNTLSDSWDKLSPPPKDLHSEEFYGNAVLNDDVILFNNALAYVVSKNKWYPVVSDPGHLCSYMLGQAVVVNDIIYAFNGNILVIFALRKDKDDDTYTCDLHWKHVYRVPSLENVQNVKTFARLHKQLVHLGKDNFCVVHNWDMGLFYPGDRQYIQLTYITLSQQELIVTGIRLHAFEIPIGDAFIMTHCFSLPNSNFNALEEGKTREQEADFVTLPPNLLQFMEINDSKCTFSLEAEDEEDSDSEAEDTTSEVHEDVSKKPSASVVAPESKFPTIVSTISEVTVTEASTHGDVVVSRKSDDACEKKEASTHGDVVVSGKSDDAYEKKGHYICVKNLPLHLRLDELEKELKKFGPFKVVSIDLDHSQMSNSCVVEFKSATSKQNAIKGSPINIGGCKSLIEEKSGSSLTRRDSNCSSSSDDSSNKVKNHNEDKLTSGVRKPRKKSRKQRKSKGGWK